MGIKYENEKILKAKIFDNGFVFYTITNQFYFVYNIYEPYVGRFLDISEIKMPPENFVVVSPKHTLSERIEI